MHRKIKTKLLAAVLLLGIIVENSHAQSFLTNGLVAYYPFNGNANDESGNGNNGTNYGAKLTTDRFGNSNAAYFFNGSNWIDIGPVVSRYDTMSISAWISTKYPSGPEGAIVSKPNDPSLTGSRLGMYEGAFDGGFASVGTYFINEVIFGSRSANNGVWHQGVYVNDGTNFQLFVDSQLIGVQSYFPQVSTNTEAMLIGREFPTNWGSGTRNFSGAIDDVRIYNRALTSFEVAQLYAVESGLLNIHKAVYLDTGNLLVGSNYQIQVSLDLMNWTNYGGILTATNAYWRSTNYWDVENWNQLFFRFVQQ